LRAATLSPGPRLTLRFLEVSPAIFALLNCRSVPISMYGLSPAMRSKRFPELKPPHAKQARWDDAWPISMPEQPGRLASASRYHLWKMFMFSSSESASVLSRGRNADDSFRLSGRGVRALGKGDRMAHSPNPLNARSVARLTQLPIFLTLQPACHKFTYEFLTRAWHFLAHQPEGAFAPHGGGVRELHFRLSEHSPLGAALRVIATLVPATAPARAGACAN
jgi:hypothetical protein